MSDRGIVLIISATDSSCGAGAFQDVRTVTELGLVPVVAVTAVTAQTGIQVLQAEPVKKSCVKDVLRTALAPDIVFKIRAVKIGLIPTDKVFRAVESFLIKLREIRGMELPVIWDPVTVAGNGDPLSELDIRRAALDLLPMVTMVTPNVTEAMQMSDTKQSLDTTESCGLWARTAADWFAEAGAEYVYIKGGHLEQYTDNPALKNMILNMLCSHTDNRITALVHRRTFFNAGEPDRVHGTGCALSSAIAAFLGLGYPMEEALTRAEMYISRRIRESRAEFSDMRILGDSGKNPEFEDLPLLFRSFAEFRQRVGDNLPGFPECPRNLGLYPVVPDNDWLRRCLEAGVRTVQLRIKSWKTKEELREEIRKAVALGHEFHARVFIDDHWELAAEEHAYGVHLGQEDLEACDLAFIRKSGLRLGVSTHSYAEACRALQIKPSYIAIGHIFPTNSKKMPSAPQGTDKLAEYVRMLGRIYPLVAIGGIKLDNAEEVLNTGVGSIAVITAITEAPDPEAAIKDWQEQLLKHDIRDTEEGVSENSAKQKASALKKPQKKADGQAVTNRGAAKEAKAKDKEAVPEAPEDRASAEPAAAEDDSGLAPAAASGKTSASAKARSPWGSSGKSPRRKSNDAGKTAKKSHRGKAKGREDGRS